MQQSLSIDEDSRPDVSLAYEPFMHQGIIGFMLMKQVAVDLSS